MGSDELSSRDSADLCFSGSDEMARCSSDELGLAVVGLEEDEEA